MSGYRVMIVTEQPAFREMLTRLVHECGFEAFPAADGIDALRQIYHVQPHVIVSDAALHNLSGFELLPFVRRRFPEIGVIALKETPRDDQPTLVLKADVILPVDPFNPGLFGDFLLGLISQYPFRAEFAPQDSAAPRSATTATATTSCNDCEELLRNAGRFRMNAVLARVWHQLNPSKPEAARQDTDADIALSDALNELHEHQQQAHGFATRHDTVPRTASNERDGLSSVKYAAG